MTVQENVILSEAKNPSVKWKLSKRPHGEPCGRLRYYSVVVSVVAVLSVVVVEGAV